MSGGYFPEYSNVLLQNLGNVEARNVADGDNLVWSSSLKKWIPLASNNSWKRPVRLATTGALTYPYTGLLLIDSVVSVAGDRILVKNQTNPVQNGVWVVEAVGSWVRATDMLDGSDAAGAALFINEGVTNADTVRICTSDTAVVGTDALVFGSITSVTGAAGANTEVQFNSGGNLAADSRLTFTTVTGTLSSTAISDGVGTLTGGALGGMTTGFFTGTVTAGGLTDGTTVLTGGTITGPSSITATTLTDGTTTLNSGQILGATNLTATGQVQLASLGTFAAFGATPVPQPTPTGTTTGHSSLGGTALQLNDTYTGNTGTTAYTIGDVVRSLKRLGFLAN